MDSLTDLIANERLRDIARLLSGSMQCNCDLDNWEPERSTGHSRVCRIHKAVMQKVSMDMDAFSAHKTQQE